LSKDVIKCNKLGAQTLFFFFVKLKGRSFWVF